MDFKPFLFVHKSEGYIELMYEDVPYSSHEIDGMEIYKTAEGKVIGYRLPLKGDEKIEVVFR